MSAFDTLSASIRKGNWIPKGSMCTVCENANRDCSSLPFITMPIMKKIKDLTDIEFNKAKRDSMNIPFSKFAIFHMKLKGFDLFLHNKKRLKWDVFVHGCNNADTILNDLSIIKAIKR